MAKAQKSRILWQRLGHFRKLLVRTPKSHDQTL